VININASVALLAHQFHVPRDLNTSTAKHVLSGVPTAIIDVTGAEEKYPFESCRLPPYRKSTRQNFYQIPRGSRVCKAAR